MNCLVLGAGGFIGHNLVNRLVSEGHWVRGVDIKYPEFQHTNASEFVIADLTTERLCESVITLNSNRRYSYYPTPFNKTIQFDRVYNLAAQMGGANYIFSKDYDSTILNDSARINLNIAKHASKIGCGTLFFSSSACIYPESLQEESKSNALKESDAWLGKPDSVYGIEKLFSEQLYDSYRRNNNLNIRIAIFHNIFGENGTIEPLRSKAPAALCVKVAKATDGEEIEIMGSGNQVRSFLYIDECLDGIEKLMQSDYYKPLNIGSSESISINDLAKMVINISGKDLKIKNIPSNTIGVGGRNSDNTLCREVLNWEPKQPLRTGMEKLYRWVNEEVKTRG